MQSRWAVMSADGDWARDDQGKVLTFFDAPPAQIFCDTLNAPVASERWTVEEFTVDDALEEAARSPFAGEGGL
jgi:hypothetical protein